MRRKTVIANEGKTLDCRNLDCRNPFKISTKIRVIRGIRVQMTLS